mgnify:CR=1 FL=1
MANYTTHNSDNKRSKKIQMIHLLPVTSIGGGNASILSQPFKYFHLYFSLYPHDFFQIHPSCTAFQPAKSVLFFHDLVYPDRADHHPAVTLCRSCPDRDVRFCYPYFIRNFSRCIQLFPVFVKNTVACVLIRALLCLCHIVKRSDLALCV